MRVTSLPSPEDADLDGLPGCPYKGLEPYNEWDGDYFFGRDGERDLVIANLMASRLTVLYGPSGVGKSSLLQAGVLRQLRRLSDGAFSYVAVGRAVAVYHASWRDDPLADLAVSLRDAIPPELLEDDLVPAHVPLSVELLREVTERLDADVYLLCDQFEDAAYYRKGSAGEAFAAELGRIVGAPGLRVGVLLGIREDAVAKLDRFEAHASGPFTNRLRLHHLDEAAAREAIEQPLHRHNASLPSAEAVGIEPSLVDELLRELQTGRVVVGDGARGGVDETSAGIETPFLQLVMRRLWWEERTRGSRLLRRSTLAQLGGAERIVKTHLDAEMSQLPEEQREVAAQVFRCLVTRSGMKMAYTADDLADFAGIADRALVTTVLDYLADSERRVLRPIPSPLHEPGPPRYQIFHDVMAEAVLEWQRGYKAARDRRAAQRRLGEVALGAVVLIALLSVAIVVQGRNLQSQRDLALSRQLPTVANALAPKQPDTAVLLSLQSLSLGRNEDQQPPAALLNALTNLTHVSRRFTEPGDVRGLAVSRTGLLAVALGDGDIQLRNMSSGQELGLWHAGAVTGVAFSPDGRVLATAGADGLVRLWNVPGGEPRGRPLPDRKGVVYDVTFSRDGHLLATAGAGSVRLWNVGGGRARGQELEDQLTGAVFDVAFSPDGKLLAAAGSRGLQLWDISSARPLGRLLSAPKGVVVNRVTFSGDGKLLASANSDGLVRLWDIPSGHSHGRPLPGHTDAVTGVAFSADGKLLASASRDTTVRLWDVASGHPRGHPFAGHAGPVIAVEFSPDGRELASADTNRTVRVWTVAEETVDKPLSGHAGKVNQVAFSPDGALLASASDDRTVRLWEVASRRPHGRLLGHRGPVTAVAFSRDGRWLASASNDGTARLWDVASQRPHGPPLSGHTGPVHAVTFSPDGSLLATAGEDGLVWLWDVPSGKRRGRPLQDQMRGVYDVAISPDGQLLATASGDHNVRLWDVAREQRRGRPLVGHGGEVVAVAFSPDGRLLASAGVDRTVRVWDVASGRLRAKPLAAHTGRVSGVAFSPDGKVLASAAGDGMGLVRLWNVSDGTPRSRPLISQTGVVWDVAFSPDRKRPLLALARWDDDKTIRLWNVNPTSWAEDGCGLVGRNLSQQEWNQFVAPFLAGLGSERNWWNRFVGHFVNDVKYQKTCPRLAAGDGAPRNAPQARYDSPIR